MVRIGIGSFLLALLLAPGPLNDDQTADQVIGRYLDAIGGVERLDTVDNVVAEGVVLMVWPDRTEHVKRQRVVKREPGSFFQQWLYPDVEIRLASSPAGSWRLDMGSMEVAPWTYPDTSPLFRLFFRRIFGPFRDTENDLSFHLTGEKPPHRMVSLRLRGEPIATLYFNSETDLLDRLTYGDVTVEYRDYREVSGVLFPFLISETVEGKEYQHVERFTDMRVNEAIDPLFFQADHHRTVATGVTTH